jgi:cobalt transporter subunit CbtB
MSIDAAVKHADSSKEISKSTQSLSALILGAVVIFCVGFLPLDVAHNAAHDTRHTLAFPCH